MSRFKKSYIEKRETKRKVFFVILCIVIVFVAFSLVSKYLAKPCFITSDSMEPSLNVGDWLIVTPIGKTKLLEEGVHNSLADSSRGQLVLVDPLYKSESSALSSVGTSIASFFSFQKAFPFSEKSKIGGRASVRRLLAFPGEEIYMDKFVLYIKPVGEEHFLTEFELSDVEYEISTENILKEWFRDLPFSDSFSVRTLGQDEYFVLCDNRATGTDSRYWLPLKADDISGRVVLRYWPFSSFTGY